MEFLKPHAERIFALLRIVAGFMLTLHGMQKVFGMFGGMPPEAPSFVVYGAGSIELVCGVLIAIGLFASPAAFLASGNMAAAYFLGHVIPSGNILPVVNKGGLAALFCFVFLYISAHGPGLWSVDAARRRARP